MGIEVKSQTRDSEYIKAAHRLEPILYRKDHILVERLHSNWIAPLKILQNE